MQIRKAPRRCLSSWAEDHEGRPYKVKYESSSPFLLFLFYKTSFASREPQSGGYTPLMVAVETTDLQAPNIQQKEILL